jgi:hypothetical protein
VSSQSIARPCNEAHIQKELAPESAQREYISKQAGEDKGLLSFYDQNPSYNVNRNGVIDSVRSSTSGPSTDWKKFFERPVEIHTALWSVGSTLNFEIDPWTLWLQNARISNRLNNYRNFRGSLNIKVLLNGNNFYWGRALLSYLPYERNAHYISDFSLSHLITASQRMHLWIDPSTSQGGEMKLPFFYKNDSLDLTNYFIGDSPGVLQFISPRTLEKSAGTQPIRISVYAWCEDIELSGPTSINFSGIQAQSGICAQSGDEFSDRPISKAANIVSSTADVMSKVPGIGSWALASKMVADGIGKVAYDLGFSRPREIANNEARRIQNVGDMQFFDSIDTSRKLSMAVKNEVTVDPSVTGVDLGDELTIEHLCSKESYLASRGWSTANARDQVLFSCGVMPSLYALGSFALPATEQAIFMTPMAAVSTLFSFWRGTIRFRVQVGASGYHKGRLVVQHDARVGSTPTEYNVVQTRIVDIAEEKDFYVDIPYVNPKGGLSTLTPALMSTASPFSVVNNTSEFQNFTNGYFSIKVENELVGPDANVEPVYIYISVCAPSIQFWGTKAGFTQTTYVPQLPAAAMADERKYITKQSGVVMSDADADCGNASPEGENSIKPTDGDTDMSNKVALIYSGERVASLRQYIKRYSYNYSKVAEMPSMATGEIYQYVETNRSIPIQRFAPETGSYFTTVNPAVQTSLGYVMQWFAAYRGGIRRKIVFGCGDATITSVAVSRQLGSMVSSVDRIVTGATVDRELDVTNSFKDVHADNQPLIITTKEGSNVVEISNPWYDQQRFQEIDLHTAGQTALSFEQGYGLSFQRQREIPETNEALDVVMHHFVAAGDDFNLIYFNGIPPVWLATN